MRSPLLALALCLLASTTHAATRYTVTDLGALPVPHQPGKTDPYNHPGDLRILTYSENMATTASALNDKGQVAGQSNGQAFLWQNGTMSGLGVLPSPGINDYNISRANAISGTGEIVGGSGAFSPIVMSGLYICYPFRTVNGKMTSFATIAEAESYEAFGVNNQGDIVGLNGYHAFFLHGKSPVDLGTLSHVPAGNRSHANGINERGQVVGSSTISVRRYVPYGFIPTHAALWQQIRGRWRATDLGTLPGFAVSVAHAINNRGQIVGGVRTYQNPEEYYSTDYRAFLWNGRHMIFLPGKGNSVARAINDRGQIVGMRNNLAVLWQDGRMYNLNSLTLPAAGRLLTDATGINTQGQIVANGMLHGHMKAFLLTPQ